MTTDQALRTHYYGLQERQDVHVIEGFGANPARIMLIFGCPTALAQQHKKLDVGTIHQYRLFVEMFTSANIIAQMFTTCLLKHRDAQIDLYTASDMHNEWLAVGSPRIVVTPGFTIDFPEEQLASIRIPSLIECIKNSKSSEVAWREIAEVYDAEYQ